MNPFQNINDYYPDTLHIDHSIIKAYSAESKQYKQALTNTLNGYTHTNRNNKGVDVRKINRRYATNLYYWYWERAKLFMNEQEFNATFMGSILFTKKRK